jgi:dTDP-4-dehydrorhamnose 3,5-epimerase
MEIEKTKFRDVLIFKPKVFRDERGYFVETYNRRIFNDLMGREIDFVQDNESYSEYGVMRGLHFQEPPYTQAKLIRVANGALIDIIVDIKTDSETFGEILIVKLDDVEKKQLFVPRGYAHGFVAVEDDTVINYKVDNKYAPAFDSGILFGSMEIDFREEIGHEEFIISEKDKLLLPFSDCAFFKTEEYNLKG